MNLATGQFGNAEVAFAYPGQKIPVELQVEFELLRMFDHAPDVGWIARLERHLRHAAQPRPWAILRVTPNMERKVAAALGPKTRENPHGAGLTVYVPVEKYRPANAWKTRTRALLPGYIFVDLRSDEDLDTARKNHAVRDVMSVDGKPVRVLALDIGSLIFMEACGAYDRTRKPVDTRRRTRRGGKVKAASAPVRLWEHGKRVRITAPNHALHGFNAEVLRDDGTAKIHVLVRLFGRPTSAEVHETWLEEL